MLFRMKPLGGVLARLVWDNTLKLGAKQLQHGIEEKVSYDSTITNPSSSKLKHIGYDKEKIITKNVLVIVYQL